MIPMKSVHERHEISVVKTADGWQGTIYSPRGDLLTKTAFHPDSARVLPSLPCCDGIGGGSLGGDLAFSIGPPKERRESDDS